MAQFDKDRRQDAVAEGVGRGDAHDAVQRRLHALDPPLDGVHGGLDLARGLDDLLAVGRDRVAARGLVEDRAAVPVLEGGDPAQHGRVVHPQRPRRPRDRAAFGHGQNEAQIVPIRLVHKFTNPLRIFPLVFDIFTARFELPV